MKIALVKRRCSLKSGGSERYCVNLARALTRAGHAVTVIGETIDDELRSEFDFLPVRTNRLTSWTSNRSFAENSGSVARQRRFDIIYGLGRAFGLDAVRVTERLQSHWLNVYYGNPVSRWLQRLNPRHRTLIALERSIYRSDAVKRVITQSHLDRRLVREYYGIPDEKIRTIHNGVDTSLFHPGVREHSGRIRKELAVPGDVPLLIFASMDFAGKGLGSILQALAQCGHREARLVVLGDGPVERFSRMAARLGVADRVIFAGRRGNIQEYYGAADLMLLPSAYEPFPNVNLEAMACGLPVLTTCTHGGADIINHGANGYLISHVHAVDEIAAAIDAHLAYGAHKRTAMAAACWETAQKLTLETNVHKTLDVFDEVLREKFRV